MNKKRPISVTGTSTDWISGLISGNLRFYVGGLGCLFAYYVPVRGVEFVCMRLCDCSYVTAWI